MLRLTKPYLNHCEAQAVNQVLESGWLAEGEATRQFESAVSRYVGSRFAVAVCNCTVALELCLKAENIRKIHRRVAVPSFTHPATVIAIINAGCTPVLCDVSLDTYNISNCQDFTSVPVSLFGHPLTWHPHSFIVEDAACSLGSSVDGVKTGSRFTTCFSFHPRKLITTGEGAVITTNSIQLASKLRELKNFGRNGGNYRFDDLRASVGIEQLKKLPAIIKTRIEMATIYSRLLEDVEQVKTPEVPKNVVHTYQTYAVLLDEEVNRDQVIAQLARKGVEAQIGTYAVHKLPAFRHLKRTNGLKNSARLYRSLLALPMSYDLSFDDQKLVVQELKNAILS